MKRLSSDRIYAAMSNIDPALLSQAMPPSWIGKGRTDATKPGRRPRRAFIEWMESPLAAVILSTVVAVGILVAIVLAGRSTPVNPVTSPTDTETGTGTESDTRPSEPEVDPAVNATTLAIDAADGTSTYIRGEEGQSTQLENGELITVYPNLLSIESYVESIPLTTVTHPAGTHTSIRFWMQEGWDYDDSSVTVFDAAFLAVSCSSYADSMEHPETRKFAVGTALSAGTYYVEILIQGKGPYLPEVDGHEADQTRFIFRLELVEEETESESASESISESESESETESETLPDENAPSFTDKHMEVVVITWSANIRLAPDSTPSTISHTVTEGTALTVIAENESWYRLEGDLYVAKSVVANAAVLKDFTPVNEQVIITTAAVYVRSYPSAESDSTVRGSLKEGDTVTRVGVSDAWSRIRYAVVGEDGTQEIKEYYIHNDYLSPVTADVDWDAMADAGLVRDESGFVPLSSNPDRLAEQLSYIYANPDKLAYVSFSVTGQPREESFLSDGSKVLSINIGLDRPVFAFTGILPTELSETFRDFIANSGQDSGARYIMIGSFASILMDGPDMDNEEHLVFVVSDICPI